MSHAATVLLLALAALQLLLALAALQQLVFVATWLSWTTPTATARPCFEEPGRCGQTLILV